MSYEEMRSKHGLPSAAEIDAATPEGRRQAWVGARSGRAIEAEGDEWVARASGSVVNRHRFLVGLMDLLEPR